MELLYGCKKSTVGQNLLVFCRGEIAFEVTQNHDMVTVWTRNVEQTSGVLVGHSKKYRLAFFLPLIELQNFGVIVFLPEAFKRLWEEEGRDVIQFFVTRFEERNNDKGITQYPDYLQEIGEPQFLDPFNKFKESKMPILEQLAGKWGEVVDKKEHSKKNELLTGLYLLQKEDGSLGQENLEVIYKIPDPNKESIKDILKRPE